MVKFVVLFSSIECLCLVDQVSVVGQSEILVKQLLLLLFNLDSQVSFLLAQVWTKSIFDNGFNT